MNTEEYLALYQDYNFRNFLDLSSAVKSTPKLIAKLKTIGRVSPQSKHYIYEFDIFDANGNWSNMYAGKWFLSRITYHYYYWHWYTNLTITCPNKSTRNIQLLDFYTIKNSKSGVRAELGLKYIINIQEYLDTFRHFKDWTYYDLNKENQKLKEEIKEQKQQIERLKKLSEST